MDNERERRAKQTIFVHSSLDDFGLSASEFRVFAHLYRRKNNKTGTSWPGIDSIAEKCRLSKQTVCDAIKHLEKHKMIDAIRTSGSKTQYVVKAKTSDVGTWEPFPNLDSCVQCNPCLKEGTRKGYPSEGYPPDGNREGNPSVPVSKVPKYAADDEIRLNPETGDYEW